MIREITMYRAECDQPDCDASPQDASEFYCWADAGMAVDQAIDAEWAVRPDLLLCPDHGHRTVCMGDDQECPRRDVSEGDDGWMYCPAHISEGADEQPEVAR